MAYRRADFAPLRETGYGVGVHWTTATVPREGQPVPYDQAVADFDVPAFVDRVRAMGAGHVLFTSTHSRHHMPCPHPVVDRILPGRTCERDLLMDLAGALADEQIGFILYYNSGIHAGDPQWREACGADDDDPSRFFSTWQEIIATLGERYGTSLTAFWFDGGYELEALGDTPWASLTAAARAGHPGRLVCYNPGIERHTLYTECQDYWAGEVCRLNYLPRGEATPAGLPWHAFVSWHGDSRKPGCGHWCMNAENRDLPWRSPPAQSAADFVRSFQGVGGAVTFNVFCYQDGSIHEGDMRVMQEASRIIRGAARQW
ncbi:MAG: alpha-L-fucosidase [Armatimonadota bacterium]